MRVSQLQCGLQDALIKLVLDVPRRHSYRTAETPGRDEHQLVHAARRTHLARSTSGGVR